MGKSTGSGKDEASNKASMELAKAVEQANSIIIGETTKNPEDWINEHVGDGNANETIRRMKEVDHVLIDVKEARERDFYEYAKSLLYRYATQFCDTQQYEEDAQLTRADIVQFMESFVLKGFEEEPGAHVYMQTGYSRELIKRVVRENLEDDTFMMELLQLALAEMSDRRRAESGGIIVASGNIDASSSQSLEDDTERHYSHVAQGMVTKEGVRDAELTKLINAISEQLGKMMTEIKSNLEMNSERFPGMGKDVPPYMAGFTLGRSVLHAVGAR